MCVLNYDFLDFFNMHIQNTLKYEKKYESFRHLFKRFVQTADSFKNEPSASLYDWLLNH